MGLHDPLPERITKDLEPILALPDPRPKISAYHSMPYAIFRYDPAEEFALRAQVGMLQTRLEQRGKRVTRISLAECLDVAMRSERPLEDWFEAERSMGTNTVVDTVHDVLSDGGLLECVFRRIRSPIPGFSITLGRRPRSGRREGWFTP